MCEAPGKLPNGQLIACRKCKQCQSHFQMDWEGRCIAESKTCRHAHFITLTYGRVDEGGKPVPYYVNGADADHERAAVLTYSDVQKWFKRLRAAGHQFRYFVSGEYGSTKGRTHWHVLMFWISVPPKVTLGVRFDWTPWPHGYTQFDPLTVKDVNYACKYVTKEWMQEDAQSYFASSKNPALGHRYFDVLARRYAEQWLAPQDLIYTFPEATMRDGKLVRYRMKSVTADNFVRAYVNHWAVLHPGEHMPWSPLVDMYQDRWTRGESTESFDLAQELEGLANRPVRRKAEFPYIKAPRGTKVLFQEPLNTWVATDDSGQLWYWSYDEEGERAWTHQIVAESDADVRREKRDAERNKLRHVRGYAEAYRRQSNG